MTTDAPRLSLHPMTVEYVPAGDIVVGDYIVGPAAVHRVGYVSQTKWEGGPAFLVHFGTDYGGMLRFSHEMVARGRIDGASDGC